MKRPRFVLSLITQDNDYQVEQAASAEETAHQLGVDVKIVFADNDAIQQSQQILEFIQSRSAPLPDGIILEPAGGTALPQVARAAVAAGIGWVVLNRHAEYLPELRRMNRVPAFAVSSDSLEVGRLQARQLTALLPNGGTALYLQGPSDSVTAKLRTDGMMATKSLSIQLKTMKAQWTEASAYKAVTAWLRLSTSQQSHVDVICAQNDAMAVGARKAFQEAQDLSARDRWLSLPYLGCDGVPNTGQAWVRSGLLAATVVILPLAGQGLEMLASALKTGAIPPELTLVAPSSFPTVDKLTRRSVQSQSASAAKI